MSKQNCNFESSCRLGKVGGQAVIEGVMMKAGERTVTTCRKEDGSLIVSDDRFVSVRKKNKFLNIPILRGIVNFVEMMMLSFKTLEISANALGLDDEKEESGGALTHTVMIISLILGFALMITLFLFLPTLLAELIDWLADGKLGAWRAAVEGGAKVAILVVYLLLISLMRDIKRTFMYHGAEHKTIACFEAGEELTPENAMKHSRFHPRCGTSFMFFMILLGIIAGFIIRFRLPDINRWIYLCIRLAILLPIIGIGYEFIMYAGKHPNLLTRILSAPGLWMQRITTKEPTLDMLEVAITSTKCAMRDDFPEFMEFFNNREWEKNDSEGDTPHLDGENADNEGEQPHISNDTSNNLEAILHNSTEIAKNEENAPHSDENFAESAVDLPHFVGEDGSETADIKLSENTEV